MTIGAAESQIVQVRFSRHLNHIIKALSYDIHEAVLGSLSCSSIADDFLLQLGFISSHQLINLFPIFYEEKSRHCLNIPCCTQFLDKILSHNHAQYKQNI